MRTSKSRRISSPLFIEAIEQRQLMSAGMPVALSAEAPVSAATIADVAAATVTTLAAPSSALLGQDITFTVMVTTDSDVPVSGGSVDLLNNGTPTGLSATVNAGVATFTFGAGNALYAGDYSLSAQYLGTSNAAASTSASTNLTISLPSFTTSGDGLQVATVTPGTGPAAVTGQTVTAEYTGFYQSDGSEFDESAAHAPGTFSYTLNANPEQVITGFDEGTAGIEQGETRVLVIPSNLGYMDGKVRIFVIQSVAPGTQTFGPAAQLAIGTVPNTAAVGQAISTPIIVSVVDASAVLVTTDTSSVTLSIESGPAGGTLGGATTLVAQGGQATFSDLTFSQPGTYTLAASDGSLSSATSEPITVTAAAASVVVPTLGNVVLPAAAVAGAKIAARVPVVVTNEGAALKGNVTVNVYANTTTALDGSQVLVGTMTKKNLSLKANKTHAFKINIKTLPATIPNGTYYLLAEVVDPSGATNVTPTSQTITVAAPFVQPTISTFAVTPSSILTGKSGSLVVTITNAGNVPARGFDLTLNFSSDGVAPLPGVIVQKISPSAKIAPSKSKTFKLHFKATNTLAAGTFFPYISLTLDGVSTSAVGAATFTVG